MVRPRGFLVSSLVEKFRDKKSLELIKKPLKMAFYMFFLKEKK